MSALAAATVATLLVASPSTTDADRVAANGGFLLGNAHRCGIAGDRVVQAGQLVRDLIAATAEDARAQEEATSRFARFFLVTAVFEDNSTPTGPSKSQPVASCQKVAKEFERLERHLAAGHDAAAPGGVAGMHFRLSDGE
jgi:hypothetical protein